MALPPFHLRPTLPRVARRAGNRPVRLRPAGVRPARGFSLVEAMVSAGIVGVMLVASVNLLSSAARTRAADSNRRTALLLAQQLISEVQQQPYKDESLVNLTFGPELGENTRADFDDVDDYSNYQEKPPVDRNGAVIVGFEAWKRKVRVQWVYPDTLGASATDTGLKRIDVTAIDPRGVETTVSSLRAERSATADAPITGSTYVTETDIELQVGGSTPRHILTGVNPISKPYVK